MARNFKRDAKGRFARTNSLGKKKAKATRKAANRSAKTKMKADKARNKAGFKNRVRGSRKARLRELRTNKKVRAKNVTVGATKYAAGRVLGDAALAKRGSSQLGKGVKGNLGRVASTKAMSRGLLRSQNKAAKKRYKVSKKANSAAYRAARSNGFAV